MSKEKLEGLNTNNNVLTSKGTRAFKRRNVVKVALAATSLVGGTGVGVGVGYAIFNQNSTPTPVPGPTTPIYNVVFNSNYEPSMEVEDEQTITATAHDGSELVYSASGLDKGTKWTFDTTTHKLKYVAAFSDITNITITATSINASTDSNSINIALLPLGNTPVEGMSLVASSPLEIPECVVYNNDGKASYKPLFDVKTITDIMDSNVEHRHILAEEVVNITGQAIDDGLLTYYFDNDGTGQLHVMLGTYLYKETSEGSGVWRETAEADRFLPNNEGYYLTIKFTNGSEQKVKIIINPKGATKEYVTNEIYRAVGFKTSYNKHTYTQWQENDHIAYSIC